MKKILVTLILLSASNVFAYDCGIIPIQPIEPLNCGELVPICECTGEVCSWKWVCLGEYR